VAAARVAIVVRDNRPQVSQIRDSTHGPASANGRRQTRLLNFS
jgi:hypothetical protein